MIRFDAKGVRWSPAARLDLYAVGLSTLCMLHCVAPPVLVSLMPLAAQAAESELVHRVLVVAAIPVTLRVIWKTMPVDGDRLFPAAALVGLVLLLLAAFVEAVSPYEEPITVAGSALLCSAHLWHWVRTCARGGVHGLPIEPDEP
ncbi:MAG: MerC domain-containing protein [Rhodospirillaceae bacterium]|nr:MerC domain-containing protein [Rhodospirillaceae bacterium]